jgi:NAD(P)-dependent dehydrogenase (short-subunit alcohol dehydrogenase family)
MTLPAINPGTLFDVRGKSALVVGATGAFGKVACATLGRAGARLTIAAANVDELSKLVNELAAERIESHSIARRSNSEADALGIVESAVSAYGCVDILVVASGMNDVSPIVDMSQERFARVMQSKGLGSLRVPSDGR